VRIAIATCSQLPTLDPDDRLLVQALEGLGARVTPVIWNGGTTVREVYDVCIVRSTWDYHKDPEGFLHWVSETSTKTSLLNPPELLRWNAHKCYLNELEGAGVPVVPTYWLLRGQKTDLSELLNWLGWSNAVIKPAHGASGDGIQRVHPENREVAQEHLTSLIAREDVLVQPYLSTVSTHYERALVFVAGEFSHAVSKMPFMHSGSDLAKRATLPPGASGEVPVKATEQEISVAARALEVSPQGHVFARVDVVHDGVTPRVLEVEMIEPTLYFYAEPSAAEKLARAILECRTTRPSRIWL
jgi:glutathione synthase/RimK-type ligase-like ATP-grasp enzyme